MSDSSAEEEVFEVEQIQGHKFTKKNKEVLYFIKWLNYPPEDNTWEKEANVFAIDLIEKYWSVMPSTSKERLQFEKLNNNRKEPIKLTSLQKQIPTVISADSASPPASFSNSTTTTDASKAESSTALFNNNKQQQTLDTVFGVYKGKGKEKEEVKPARLPQVIATTNNEDDEIDDDDDDDDVDVDVEVNVDDDDVVPEIMEIDISDDEAYATPNRSNFLSDDDEADVQEITPKPIATKRSAKNDSKQQDYFLKQHEKKRKREELGFDDDSSVESMSPPPHLPKIKKAVIDIEELQDDEEIIFDEKYAIDPPLDWVTQAERVEYIGKEIDQSDLYCLVSWKDGVKSSMHPLNLVREKRPDLIIDRFVQMIMQQ